MIANNDDTITREDVSAQSVQTADAEPNETIARSAKLGTLYGVGVGPGDPELMTLKAHRLITQATTIAYFCKGQRPGHGRTVIAEYIPTTCREIRMAYPVTTEIPVHDPRYGALLSSFYDDYADQMSAILSAGEDVVVISEGDPFFYGSFMPIFHRLSGHFKTEVVPGIPAMAGAWAKAGAPITYGDDVLMVLPGTLPENELRSRIASAEAFVIMKLGRHFEKVRSILSATGHSERAIYVERCTMTGERIIPLKDADPECAPYFSMILVPGRGRLF